MPAVTHLETHLTPNEAGKQKKIMITLFSLGHFRVNSMFSRGRTSLELYNFPETLRFTKVGVSGKLYSVGKVVIAVCVEAGDPVLTRRKGREKLCLSGHVNTLVFLKTGGKQRKGTHVVA